MADSKKNLIDKLKSDRANSNKAPSRSDVGMDGFSGNADKGSDNGNAPGLSAKPSKPVRRSKPKSDNG